MINDWYRYKAKQCRRLAADASSNAARTKFAEEAALWREIAGEAAKQELHAPP